jgi:hypothetical protein
VFRTWGRNAPAEKLGIGLPFFGRVIGTSRNPQAGEAYRYRDLATGGTTTGGNYYTYLEQEVWIPGPDLVEQRVEFAHSGGLQNIIIWEIGQDLPPDDPGSLLRTAFETKRRLLAIPEPATAQILFFAAWALLAIRLLPKHTHDV